MKYGCIGIICLLMFDGNIAVCQREKKNTVDHKFALEIPLSITKSFILVEDQLAKYVEVNEKLSTDIGLGFSYSLADFLSIRFGCHYWKLPINPSYEATLRDAGREFSVRVVEESKLKNSSIYMHLLYEGNNGFIGGGFNIGISNSYTTKLSFYDETGDLMFSESGDQSLITNKFSNQSHFELIGGLKINTKTRLGFKPFVRGSIPFQAIYDSETPKNTAYDMFGVILNFGLIVDVGLL